MCKHISSIHASPMYLSGIYLGFRVSFSYLEIIPISGSVIHNLIREGITDKSYYTSSKRSFWKYFLLGSMWNTQNEKF